MKGHGPETIMKISHSFVHLLIVFCFSSVAWCIPIDDLHQDKELSLESSDASILTYKVLRKKERPDLPSKNNLFSNELFKQPFTQETSVNAEKETINSSKDKQIVDEDETDYYLIEQEELDAQKPSIELYQSLAPLLTSEIKKDVKKVWVESADFREAIGFSMKDSDAKELILQQSKKEMAVLKGKALEEISNKNLPPGVDDKKEPDKEMIRELFDGIYDLLINAFLIISGVLILGKIISFIFNKVIVLSDRRKKRHTRRHSKRHRKKRHRTYA